MNESRWYTGRPAFASQLSAGPPRCISGTAAGTPRLLGGAPHLLQLVERGAQRLLDDERDAPLDQRPANLGHLIVRAEDVRELDVRQLQQPAPIGFDRGAPQLGKLADPGGVVVGEPDDLVHLGDRRRVQRDVPVRGAENDSARAAHEDTAPSA